MPTLQEELARARAERDRLNVVIEYLEQRVNTNGHRPRRRRVVGAVTVAAAAEQALGERGEPMATRELLARVRELGATARDGESLAKALTRSPRFSRPSRGMWKLV